MKGKHLFFALILGLATLGLSSCGSAKMTQAMDLHKMNLAKALGAGVSSEQIRLSKIWTGR